jgi:hypothetical protein
LEEDGYDPTEDIAWAESQSHLILAVARVSDPEQTPVLKAIEAAKKRHPEWPIIVAQTGLHDLYPAGAPHPEPNRFSDPGKLMDGTFGAVREALAHQRQLFGDLRGSAPIFVPIDFTRMEDGYAPPDYGSDELRVALVNQGLVIIEAWSCPRRWCRNRSAI